MHARRRLEDRAVAVQRQRFPERACAASSRVTLSRSSHSAKSDITKPGVQKPHCEACASTMACCTGCRLPSGARRLSTVTTSLPSSVATKRMHEFTAR
jgi:hypothetical protein